jgi:predicted enzyme related to lactoylglutathione lyase
MPETTSGSRVTAVGRVIVTVADQDQAIAFYTEKLGFEKSADIPYGEGQRWVEVVPPGTHTSIALVPPMQGDTAGHKQTGIALDTADVEATHSHLRGRGVDVDAEIMRGPDIPPMFWFRDPDANTILVVQAMPAQG